MLDVVDLYVRLQTVVSALEGMRGNLDDSIKPDTAFALGEALGVACKAKGLVGRDIDDERKAGRFSDDAVGGHGKDAPGAG